MKRIMMATVVLCLAAALQMMGQTTSTPTSQPTTKLTSQPTMKLTSQPTTKPTSQATAKPTSQATTNTTPGGAANGQGSVGALKCTGPERRPCTQEMVRDLARRMGKKSAEHSALAKINTLSLDSPDGTLSCRQNDGKPCTAEQVRSLNEHVAAEMRCDVRFEYSGSNAGNATSTHPNTTSDIAAKVEAWERTLNTTNSPSEIAAKERERERTERRMDATSEIAAKEREGERTERRMNSTSQGTAAPPREKGR